jgi:general transcription factor 3C polypeptide 3 (transcription factor C subunit 4)
MLSDKCEELQFWKQAVHCLTRSIKTADGKNVDFHWRRAIANDNLGQTKKAMKDLESVQQMVLSDEAASANVKIFLSRLYEKTGKHDQALSILMEEANNEDGTTTCVPKLVLHRTNLCLKQGHFFDALKIIEDCLSYSNTNQPDKKTRLQLHANAAIAAIQLNDEEQANDYLEKVYSEEDCDDPEVFLKIADNFYLVGDVQSALKFYKRLIGHEGYDEMPLQIKIAECQQIMNRIDEAAENYTTILSKLSNTKLEYLEVSILLAELLQQSPDSGKAVQAVDNLSAIPRVALESEPNTTSQKKLFEMFIREAKLNHQYEKWVRYLELMLPLLFYGWKENRLYSDRRKREKRARQKTAEGNKPSRRQRRQKKDLIHAPFATEGDLFHLTIECCKVLMQKKDFEKMDELLSCAVDSLKAVKPKSRRSAFRFLRAILDSHKGEHENALSLLRNLCSEHPSSNILWNFFFQVGKDCGKPSASGRYLSNLKGNVKEGNPHVLLANGHHLFSNRKHRNALAEYFQVYKLCPDNPLVALCISVTCLQYALNIKDDRRNMLIIKTFCFMEEYTKLKASCPGALYNFGRTYHQLGLIHFAQTLYNRSLQLIENQRKEEELGKGQLLSSSSNSMESKSELRVIECSAAHNLAVIYCSTGAQELASEVLRKHASIT